MKNIVVISLIGLCTFILGFLIKGHNSNSNEDALNAKLFLAKAQVEALDSAYQAERATNDVLIREIGLRKKDIRKLKTNQHENILRIDSASAGYLIGFFSRIDTSRFLE